MRTKYLLEDLKLLSEELENRQLGGSIILITGATGLIGSLCIKAIAEHNAVYDRKIKVIAMARSMEKVNSVFADELVKGQLSEIEFIYQDIIECLPCEITCDYIIHTANSTSSNYFITNPVEVIDCIYTGTKRVLDFAHEKKVEGIVYLSSMEVFGKVDMNGRICEEQLGYLDIQNVRSSYSEGKRLAELMCKAYAEEYDLPVRVARLAQTFGAGVLETDNRVFAQFSRCAIAGEDIVLHTTGKSVGNYCYTRDAIMALFLLLNTGGNGEVYTVVNEETTMTIGEMAQMVATCLSDGKSKVVFDIQEENKFGYAPDTNMKLSSEKLRGLGWEATVSLKDMYLRMIPSLVTSNKK